MRDILGWRRRRDQSLPTRAKNPPPLAEAPAPPAERPTGPSRPLIERPIIRIGAYAWAFIGLVGVLLVLGRVLDMVSLVVIPLVLALFPAAVLTPLSEWLKRQGMNASLAAVIVLVGTIVLIAGVIGALAPMVAGQLDNLQESLDEGVTQLRGFLRSGPFGLDPVDLNALIDQARQQLADSEVLSTGGALTAAGQAGRFVTGLALMLIGLFFYLRDGPRIAHWVQRLFPERMQADTARIGELVWDTIGSYFRGQLTVALIDALGIMIGLLILQVPLAVPLAVIVFFGGLFPVVGAFVSGFVAVAVALATRGFTIAVIVLLIIIAVQQLEGNILQPLILGRATALHPLAVIAALVAGGTLLGILGAFLAVPVAASLSRAVGYLRARVPG